MEPSNKDVRRDILLEETGSTNNYIKELLREKYLEEGTVVVADFQTRGRGQRGNGWSSERGKNLLFSLVIYPPGIPASAQFIISRIASLAVKKMLGRFTDDIRIKWPNDIYWKEKKIAGMLIENDLMGKEIKHSVIGIGVNVNQQQFAPELPNPVSLWQITGSEHDRAYLLDIFKSEFFSLYQELQKGRIEAIEQEYMHDLYRVNELHGYEDEKGRFQAIIRDVLPSGHLILKVPGESEERSYAFKEVAFVL